MNYQRKTLADDTLISTGELPAELQGLADESLADLSWVDPARGFSGQGFFPVNRNISALAFKQRLTGEERIGIRTAGASDPIIADFLDLLGQADLVDLDHPDTVNGCAYLVSQQLLTPERVDEILA